MIEQYFPSKRTVVKPHNYTNRYQNNYLPVVHSSGAPSAFEEARAIKMGLTVEVYRHRVTEVSREQAKCAFKVGDTVFPTDPKDLEEYGGCIVTGVCRHYHDYGTVDWNDPPLILSVQPISDRGTILNASVGWAQKKAGIYETENYGDC